MSGIDSLISAAEAKARELQEAIAALHAATQEAHGVDASSLGEQIQDALDGLSRIRREVTHAVRPKGPTVSVEWSFGEREPMQWEFIERTATVAVLHLLGKASFLLSDGTPFSQVPRTFDDGCWRISPADLERIRAMPVGENEVSRALKAAEATR